MTDIGMKIKILRISKGMRQDDLAEKLGLSKSSVSGWETGASEPSIHYVDRLCELFHTTPNYLLGRGTEESIKLDEKEKRMLTIFKEQMPEKMRDVMLTISSFVHECYASEEDSITFQQTTIGFVRDCGLRQLFQVYDREVIVDEIEASCTMLYRRKRIREFLEHLLKEEAPKEMNDELSAESEMWEKDLEEFGDRL